MEGVGPAEPAGGGVAAAVKPLSQPVEKSIAPHFRTSFSFFISFFFSVTRKEKKMEMEKEKKTGFSPFFNRLLRNR